ncbi:MULTISPECIES: hypothetical protein [unclassified Bacillus cereus group]|nr:hypothetical protein [Bacillus paranthracis]MDG1603791.1 hypothetical protein [Bacillus paranthracis]WAI27769.1 MAG: hypothetical protein NRZ50_05195 [Bacillus paranthracis]WAI34427.1 MAG: hypothetical protein NRZ52_09855 [Bacillus paranthracis]WAI37447.1 MAG: hypothetical protein NRZ51_22755 [Bacillus paranthracis]
MPRNQLGQAIIAVMALLVSISAVAITYTTNEIMKQQMEITKAEKRPLINFKRDYANDENGFAIRESLAVHNEGGLMEDFDSKMITFFDFGIWDYSKDEAEKHIIVPIKNYYIGFTTGALQKEIVTYDNKFFKEGNNKKIIEVTREFSKLKEPLEQKQKEKSDYHFEIGEGEFKTYCKVEYKDIYGEKQELYYDVSASGAKKISAKQGKSTFEKIESLSKGFYIEEVSASKLLDYVEKEMKD